MVASFCQLVTVAPRSTIIPYTTLFRSELVCASVAVQVRCVLLTSLPLTPRLASTNVTVRLVSHVWLKTHVSKLHAPGDLVFGSLGQLVTVVAELSITVMVLEQVTELVC